jgi:hypothetical protein
MLCILQPYSVSNLKPIRRKTALGGDDDECLLVDHRARTLENLISRPLNKMRSVRLRCELPPVTQSRDVLENRDHGVRKFGVGWTTRCSGSPPLRALRSLYPTCWFEIACTIHNLDSNQAMVIQKQYWARKDKRKLRNTRPTSMSRQGPSQTLYLSPF